MEFVLLLWMYNINIVLKLLFSCLFILNFTSCSQRRPCPEEDAHFLSRITWWWQNRQIWNGWRRPIKYDDLADLNAVDKSNVIAPRFQKNWDRELKKAGLV